MNIKDKLYRTLNVKWKGNSYLNSRNKFPEKIIISYYTFEDLHLYLNESDEGILLCQNIIDDKVKSCIFIPHDFDLIEEYEKYLYKLNKNILTHKNVKFYTNDKIDADFYNIIWGVSILEPFYKLLKNDISFDGKFHFLTLNGSHKPHRERLYNFLKNKNYLYNGIYSFGWQGISPDLSINDELPYTHSDLSTITEARKIQYNKNSLNYFYHDCLFEIVCPTSKYLVTEKTLKPLLYGTPFFIWFYSENEIVDEFISKKLSIINWYKNIGIDIEYFDIDYSDKNCIYKKIDELINMEIHDIQSKYKDTFIKAKENKILINNYLEKYYKLIESNTNII